MDNAEYALSLDDVSNAELTEFIQPEVFDQVVDGTKHFLNILEGIDLNSLSSSKPKLKTKSFRQKPNQGKEFKFDESDPFGFGNGNFQSTFQQSSHNFVNFKSAFHQSHHNLHQHGYPKQPSLVNKLLHKHKAMSKSGKLRPQAPSFFKHDDIIMAKHQVRQDALGDTCQTVCNNTEWVSLMFRSSYINLKYNDFH